jgi:hypothetical protein
MHLLTPIAAALTDPKIAAFIGTAFGAFLVTIIRAFHKKQAAISMVSKEKWFHHLKFRLEYDPTRKSSLPSNARPQSKAGQGDD